MLYLIIVSLIWAFSFGLIKSTLVGLDPNFVSFARLLISFFVFLPLINISALDRSTKVKFMGIGALQYGLMYIAYIYAYQFLQSYEIVLFTIFTPIFVTMTNDIIERKFSAKFFISAVIAVIGAVIILYKNIDSPDFILGFILVQISNICFAAGQIFYVRLKNSTSQSSNYSLFALLYLGAVIITLPATLMTTNYGNLELTIEQIFTLLYLGVISSGIAFYLWNVGATKVNGGTLAVFNNLKIPTAIAVSIFVFGEIGDILKLAVGSVIIISALILSERPIEHKISKE